MRRDTAGLSKEKGSWTSQAAMPSAITVGLAPSLTDNNKKSHINERNSSRRRLRHQTLPDYKRCKQTIAAHLRQADGVLSHQCADAGGDQGFFDYLYAIRPAGLQVSAWRWLGLWRSLQVCIAAEA